MGILSATYLILLIIVVRALSQFSSTTIKWYLEPMFLVSCVWIFGFLLYSLPIFTYREEITLVATIFIVIAHTAFFLGTLCGGALFSAAPSNKCIGVPNERLSKPFAYSFRVMLAVGLLGLLGLCAVAVDGLLSSGLSLGDRLGEGGLQSVRIETFSKAAGEISNGPFERFEQFVATAFLYIGMLLNFRFKDISTGKQKVLILLGLISGALIIFNQLLIRGGRMDLVTLSLFVVFAITLDPHCRARIVLAGFMARHRVFLLTVLMPLVGGVIFYLAVVFVQGRSGQVSPLDALHSYHRMGLTPLVGGLVEGVPVLETLMLSLSYFVVPLDTLSYYFGLSDAAFSGPYWGQYNFSYLSGFILRRLDMASEWKMFWEIRGEVWASLAMHGYGTNVWATLLRDLAIDFGWLGAVIGMFLLGRISKWLALEAVVNRDPVIIAAYAFTAVFLIFSFAHSMFFISSVFPPFVYGMLLYFFTRIRLRGVHENSRAATLVRDTKVAQFTK